MDTHAMVVTSFGSAPRWRAHSLPGKRPNDIHVRILAASLNFADLLMIDGSYQETPPLPFVPGMEICAVVEQVGSSVTGLEIGQRVSSFCGNGGLAQHAVLASDRCIAVPSSMDDATAAAFPVAYGTSHLALTRRAQIMPGETLAVLGAAGGVGLTAVEIGKQLGARVIAIARGRDRLAVAEKAGADVTIDTNKGDLKGALKDAGPIDVVFDPVGGKSGEATLRALTPEGRYLLIGFASGDLPILRPNHLLVKNATVIGFYWGGYMAFHPDALTKSMSELMHWYDDGRLHPHVSHVLPIAKLEEGLELLRSRRATGKVVLTL